MTGKTTEKTRARKVAIEVLQQINIFSPWKSVKNPDLQMLENSALKAGSLQKSFLERAMATKWIHGAVNIFLGKNTVSEWIQHYHNEGLNRRNNAQQQGKTFLGTKGGADGSEANDDDDEMELTVFETTRLIALEVTRSLWFNLLVICVILINSVLIAFNFEKSSWESSSWYLEMIFMSVYTTEAILKIYGDPFEYFSSNYNVFDFVILLLSFVQLILSSHNNNSPIESLRVLRALRALRALRIIGFFRSLQVIVNALITTLVTNVIDFFLFLMLIMFLFATLAVNFFSEYDYFAWGTLGKSFTTLFTFVTADNWAPFQETLILNGLNYSQWFSVLFIFVGHFLFTNLFIAVITQNIHDAQEDDLKFQANIREQNILMKKAIFMESQPLGSENSMKNFSNQRLEELLTKLQETVRHDDIFPTHNLCCDLTWIETYLITLNHQENSVYRIQQTHFEIANVLSEWLERRAKLKRS